MLIQNRFRFRLIGSVSRWQSTCVCCAYQLMIFNVHNVEVEKFSTRAERPDTDMEFLQRIRGQHDRFFWMDFHLG